MIERMKVNDLCWEQVPGTDREIRLHGLRYRGCAVHLEVRKHNPAPEGWPPKPGDVWKLNNDETAQYYVIRRDGQLHFIWPDGGYEYPITTAMIWKLAYRPGGKAL